jgi:hypothetical protein
VDSDQTTAIIEGPDPEGKYGTGTDWAKKVNHTVVVTIRKDVRPMRVVAVKRTQKEPWPSMAGHLDQRVKVYGGTSTHDNTGVGQVVHDLLHHPSDPFNMVGRDRADLLSEYIAAIEKGDLVWPESRGTRTMPWRRPTRTRDEPGPGGGLLGTQVARGTRDDLLQG